jgi:hypothetical protein
MTDWIRNHHHSVTVSAALASSETALLVLRSAGSQDSRFPPPDRRVGAAGRSGRPGCKAAASQFLREVSVARLRIFRVGHFREPRARAARQPIEPACVVCVRTPHRKAERAGPGAVRITACRRRPTRNWASVLRSWPGDCPIVAPHHGTGINSQPKPPARAS